MVKTRIKADALPIPADLEGAQILLAEIGAIDRAIEEEEQKRQDAVSKIERASNDLVRTLNEQINAKFLALKAYFEANQGDLLPKDRRSVKWPTGTVGFRDRPLSATVAKGKGESVIQQLEVMGLGECVNVKKTLNKEAAKKRRDAIEGIVEGLAFSRSTEFFAQAGTTKVEHTKAVSKPRVKRATKKRSAGNGKG